MGTWKIVKALKQCRLLRDRNLVPDCVLFGERVIRFRSGSNCEGNGDCPSIIEGSSDEKLIDSRVFSPSHIEPIIGGSRKALDREETMSKFCYVVRKEKQFDG